MMADAKQVSAPMRRRDQKLRWEESDTNLASSIPRVDNRKVKFQDGCVFLAACSSGDREEVKNLLERGADINTANVDGLTALHQACIDDNLDMVEFLVELGADVDVCDNEGWTPLHATASCAFTEIARYLIKQGANVAAVNNDGDLPYDIAENKEMENLLQDEMDKQGIDADAARCEEEERMLEDANSMLQDSSIKEQVHPKTGATPLHVASAKGYLKVMNVLLRANVDIDAEDLDGWTPLHAAVHWGQEDACKVLIEHLCDMLHKNHAGHTPFDLAEKDMRKLLEELKETQANMRDKHDVNSDIIISSGHGRTRRSSVTRMSVDQKQNVIQRNLDEERAAMVAYNPENTGDLINSIESSSTTTDTTSTTNTITSTIEGSETERKNERNKQVSQQLPSPSSRVETRRQDSMPKIDEVAEADRPLSTSTVTTLPKTTSTSSTSVISDSTTSTIITTTTPIATSTTDVSKPVDSLSTVDSRLSSSSTANDTQPQPSNLQERLSARRPISSTGSSISTTTTSTTDSDSKPERSYEPPKRDEETETQRKARAKHARQTRRSTQGVSLDDIEKAEQELKSNDASKITKDSTLLSSLTTTTSSSTTSDLDLKSIPSASSANTTLSASNTSSISSSSSSPSTPLSSQTSVDGTGREDRTTPSLSSSSFRRRMGTATDDKEKNDLSSADSVTSNLRSSHRRARHDVDTNSLTSDVPGSSDLTTNYMPRSQRNSSLLPTSTVMDGPGSTSQGITRSSSFRSSRLRNGDSMELTTPRTGTEDSSRKDKDAEGKEEKKEIHAIRARRQRRERRSTGIVMDNEEDGEKIKENKADEEKKDEALPSSRYSSRYGSNSDVPSSDRSQRPVSYSDFSRSTGSLDIDYKKKYEDEKQENSRLRKELEDTKSNLRKAKDELDSAIKQKEMARNAERDKRALERKISELEEEMKKHQQDAETLKLDNNRLKEENGALIRVISKLSK